MNETNENFLQTKANWAVVIRADLLTLDEIKKHLANFPNINNYLIYQKTSLKKLLVKEEGEG